MILISRAKCQKVNMLNQWWIEAALTPRRRFNQWTGQSSCSLLTSQKVYLVISKNKKKWKNQTMPCSTIQALTVLMMFLPSQTEVGLLLQENREAICNPNLTYWKSMMRASKTFNSAKRRSSQTSQLCQRPSSELITKSRRILSLSLILPFAKKRWHWLPIVSNP